MNSLAGLIFFKHSQDHSQHLVPAQRYTSFPAHTDRACQTENVSIAFLKHRNMHLKRLELEIKSDIGNIVEGALGQVEPNKLVSGRILVTHSAHVSTGGNLLMGKGVIW